MKSFVLLLRAVLFAGAVLLPHTAFAAGPVDMVLPKVATVLVIDHHDGGKPTKVKAKRGEIELKPARVSERITLQPGDTLKLKGQPADITLNLFDGEAGARTPVCTIHIRYFQNSAGYWVPHFLLKQDPQVIRTPDGRWLPVDEGGATDLAVDISTPLPNMEGFHPSLTFGPHIGRLRLTAWSLQ